LCKTPTAFAVGLSNTIIIAQPRATTTSVIVMASSASVFYCAALSLILYSYIGLPLAARTMPRPLTWMGAPAIGWAVHSALALPLFFAVGMSPVAVTLAFVVPVFVIIFALWNNRLLLAQNRATRTSIIALVAAAFLALTVAIAVVPKFTPDGGVNLAGPIFDHSKVALINEMARLGVPPVNPFFGGAGIPLRLAYYYLWHFSAAELSLLVHVSGWEADAALTWFTAFASLAVMVGLAIWLSGRAAAGLWVVALAATLSLRPLIYQLFDVDAVQQVIGVQSGFAGWLFQTSWAPQHTASAMCAVLATLMLVRATEHRSPLTIVLFALLMTASFESSTWVGGIVFPLAVAPVAVMLLARAKPGERLRIVVSLASAALLTLLLIAPFLYDQILLATLRSGAIAVSPYSVLDEDWTDPLARLANLPAYWLIFLVVEFPAYYLTGIVSSFLLLRGGVSAHRSVVQGFAVLMFAGLGTAWLLTSTLGNNSDLSWRAALPSIMLLIVFSAAGLSCAMHQKRRVLFVAALALIMLGLHGGAMFAYRNFIVPTNPSGKVFATTPGLWQAVRRHTSPRERVASNPAFMAQMTPWPGNISWALLANRRSCYAGLTFVVPFTALSPAQRERIDAQFTRVFAGEADMGDIQQLATQYHCAVAVLTPEDGAWSHDPFASSPNYRLVEGSAAWRIYKLVTLAAR
jgi:hypothetical protein